MPSKVYLPTAVSKPRKAPHCGALWAEGGRTATTFLYLAQNRTGYIMRKSEAKSCKNGKRKSSVRAFFCREKNALLYRFRTIDHKRLTFAFTPESKQGVFSCAAACRREGWENWPERQRALSLRRRITAGLHHRNSFRPHPEQLLRILTA